MGIIHVLDNETINQIAAGEVIERPASIVKELVENAIDSHATRITIEANGGGISFLRITDNGCGFAKEDIPVAFLRHATSKIRTGADLASIASLGFRGEALSSIAAVSRIELLTRQKEAFLGNRYLIEGGIEKGLEEAGCPEGTTFLIRDLFYNVPARRKFLKAPITEAGYISELVNRFAVSHPEISFALILQGRNALYTSGNGNMQDAIYAVYGREAATNLIPVDASCDAFSLKGYIGKPSLGRGNRVYENYFINGRYVKSALVSKAIEEAYKPFLMQHKYPFTALNYQVAPQTMDVNVHPTKMEVRFSNQELFLQSTVTILRNVLHDAILIPDLSIVKERVEKAQQLPHVPEAFEQNRLRELAAANVSPAQRPDASAAEPAAKQSHPENASAQTQRDNIPVQTPASNSHARTDTEIPSVQTYFPKAPSPSVVGEDSGSSVYQAAAKPAPLPKGEQLSLFAAESKTAEKAVEQVLADQTKEAFMHPAQTIQRVPDYRIIGQIFGTYWIVQKDQELFLIDQHAAHEKILYEHMIRDLKKQEACSQMISPPIVVSLSLREQEVLEANLETFERLGFQIASFGGADYTISAVPCTLYRLQAKDYFHELLDELSELRKGPTERVMEQIASMSCKAAIKGNTHISETEARNLITELLTLDEPFHCPHGRPIIVAISKSELDKRFKRIV